MTQLRDIACTPSRSRHFKCTHDFTNVSAWHSHLMLQSQRSYGHGEQQRQQQLSISAASFRFRDANDRFPNNTGYRYDTPRDTHTIHTLCNFQIGFNNCRTIERDCVMCKCVCRMRTGFCIYNAVHCLIMDSHTHIHTRHWE